MAIIERDGKKIFIDSNHREFPIEKHEYLREEDYYEARSVGTKARSNKCCEFCGDTIIKGVPHEMHHFYPEFESYPTHEECSHPFMLTLRSEEDEEDEV